MSWLAIDTATSRLSVAVGSSGADAVERHLDGPRQHARALLPLIDDALAAQAVSLAALEAVVVADGPGSFTGLRVGVTVAKGLHHALGLPVYSAPSLLGCALAREGAGRVVATSEALRDEVYAVLYEFANGQIRQLLAPHVLPKQRAGELAPGAVLVQDLVVDARRLLALREWSGGLARIPQVEAWTPEYGRPAEAQARWEREHGRPLTHSSGLAG
ncbi:MAG TPA: tRNA (adenosine(37)-N6)-threonylcarbamoyltransferase complex dimerization subunit type 1 TsaB [Gemmatimonadales bacterium]|jgi:tRNA threonylcarbamoyladenosine biosynthesis protein TsaB|nr:tRNA (adenosine(37)-N6)-threonylcarbamoyltransferase complex dimerization subunit type 1 TsaB [Gemmatimonadales bacterium]